MEIYDSAGLPSANARDSEAELKHRSLRFRSSAVSRPLPWFYS